MLIEDDVYSELYFGRENRYLPKFGIAPTAFCIVRLSKCLVPGISYWLGGSRKHARRIQRLQLMSTLSTSSPMQLALVDYLSTRRYDAHLRRLRRQLAERKQQAGKRCCVIFRRKSKFTTTTAVIFCGWSCRNRLMLVCSVPMRWHTTSALRRGKCSRPREAGHVFSF